MRTQRVSGLLAGLALLGLLAGCAAGPGGGEPKRDPGAVSPAPASQVPATQAPATQASSPAKVYLAPLIVKELESPHPAPPLGEGAAAFPLTPRQQKQFTIQIPPEWKAESETPDSATYVDPAQPSVRVAVYTSWSDRIGAIHLVDMWQFRDRSPRVVGDPSGLKGLMAEGQEPYDTKHKMMTVGFVKAGTGLQVAEAVAPVEHYERLRPLFLAILQSYRPNLAR